MKKKFVIISGAIMLIVAGLFTFFGMTVVNSQGCSQMVIDTNELHSGIDIPDVDFINCYYDEQQKTRVSVYKLKLNGFHLDTDSGKFHLIDQSTFSGITRLKIDEQPISDRLYMATGTKWGDQWKYIVEPATGRLWVEIIYN